MSNTKTVFVVNTKPRETMAPGLSSVVYDIVRLSDCKVLRYDVKPGLVDDICAEMNRAANVNRSHAEAACGAVFAAFGAFESLPTIDPVAAEGCLRTAIAQLQRNNCARALGCALKSISFSQGKRSPVYAEQLAVFVRVLAEQAEERKLKTTWESREL